MKKVVFMIILAMICGMMFSSCNSEETTDDNSSLEMLTLSNGRTLDLENHLWLKKLIDLSKTDKTGNYIGRIWLENFQGQDVFVTDMMLGSGGVRYYFFDRFGASFIIKGYVKYHNPLIEAFAGNEYNFIEVDEKEFMTFSINMKLKVLVYSCF